MRRLLLILLIVNGLLLPLGCLPLLLILNMFNPMQSAFITDIHITNALDQQISVTPIGAVGAEGHRFALPIYARRRPAVMSSQFGGFVIEPGQTIELLYDWDDINFSELVFHFDDGTVRQLVVDDDPTSSRYSPPHINRFTIDEATSLSEVPDEVHSAAIRAESANIQYWVLLVLLFPWVTFFVLLRVYRRIGLRHLPGQSRDLPADDI